jgi:EpsI family protein
MVFMVSAGLMLAEIVVLTRIGKEPGTWIQLFGVVMPLPAPKEVRPLLRKSPASFIVANAMLVGLVAAAYFIPRPAELIPTRTSLAQFPMELSGWRGRRQALEAIFTDQLQMDDYVLADYTDGGSPVNFYVSWYNSQRKGDAVHSPRACLPGGGWQIRSFDQRLLQGVAIDGVPLRVNRAIVELGNQRQIVYYWFLQRGRIIDNEFAVKWYLFWDALARHRTDGAMVRLVTALPLTSSETQADRRLSGFAALLAQQLPRYVPN